jgi:hypothetical protein
VPGKDGAASACDWWKNKTRTEDILKEGVVSVYLKQDEYQPICEPICSDGHWFASLCPRFRR